MAYGFYVTARGLEKIRAAMQDGGKVAINQYAVGDGADIAGERIEGITALNNELWRKTLDERDTFEAEGSRLTVKTVIPETAPSMVFNEVGYFDEEDDLIIYGTMGDTVKGESTETAPQILEHDNVLEFSGNEIEYVKISIGNEVLADLMDRVRLVEENKADKSQIDELAETVQNDVEQKIQQIEINIEGLETDISGKVDKVEGKELSSNDFTTTYKDQVDANKAGITTLQGSVTTAQEDISDLKTRVGSLETLLNGLQAALEAIA